VEPQAVRDQVFISYSKKADAGFVRFLAKALRAIPFRVWLDEEQIAAGDDYERVLQDALAQSRQAVFVVSETWLAHDWTRYESKTFTAKGRDRRRVAVLRFPRGKRDLGPELDLLHNVEWVEGQGDQASCFWQVVCGLTGEPPGPAEDWPRRGQELLARVERPQPAVATPAAPSARRAPEPRDRDGVYLSCDRGDQWSYLTDRMREPQHQIIVLPGARGEAHDEFLKRIECRLPSDPPRRIVSVEWSEYPCPRQAELLLADFAQALEVDERALAATLQEELSWRHVVLLQPAAHCFGQAPFAYFTKVLPACLREVAEASRAAGAAGPRRFGLKVVQPIEWPPSGAVARFLARLKALLIGGGPDGQSEAAAFMKRIGDEAAPDLRALRLPELTRIGKDDLEKFCEAHGLPAARRPAFIADVLRGARNSRDVLFNVQRLFPSMELA